MLLMVHLVLDETLKHSPCFNDEKWLGNALRASVRVSAGRFRLAVRVGPEKWS
jgi:hypothetical protein